MKRALLIGGSGRLGAAIRRDWSEYAIAAPAHAELDLADAAAVAAAIARESPDVVVNCAAFHDVDRCEIEPERAFAINAIAVDRAARACRERGVVFVTVGTDYVFDGRARRPYAEDDPALPLSAYGASKLAGELLVRRWASRALIVRTCGLYGCADSPAAGGSFVDRIVARARRGERVEVVVDRVASPTFAGHLARAIRGLVEADAAGVYHAAAAGPVSWYEFARELLGQAGITGAVEPIPSNRWAGAAPRPAFSALDSGKLAGLGFAMPSWREGIAAYLRARDSDGSLGK